MQSAHYSKPAMSNPRPVGRMWPRR